MGAAPREERGIPAGERLVAELHTAAAVGRWVDVVEGGSPAGELGVEARHMRSVAEEAHRRVKVGGTRTAVVGAAIRLVEGSHVGLVLAAADKRRLVGSLAMEVEVLLRIPAVAEVLRMAAAAAVEGNIQAAAGDSSRPAVDSSCCSADTT